MSQPILQYSRNYIASPEMPLFQCIPITHPPRLNSIRFRQPSAPGCSLTHSLSMVGDMSPRVRSPKRHIHNMHPSIRVKSACGTRDAKSEEGCKGDGCVGGSSKNVYSPQPSKPHPSHYPPLLPLCSE